MKLMQLSRSKFNERLALFGILLLALALRVYRLGAPAIWWDESLSVYRATRDLGTLLSNTIIIQNVVTIDTLPQLYFIFLYPLVRVFGTSEFALRFLSVMANIATIPLVYALARRWFSPSIGLLAALLAGLSPFYVAYAQEARPYALVLFWSTLAVYALTRTFIGSLRSDTFRWMIVYVAAAVASLYTHYYSIFLIPFHSVLIAILIWHRTTWRERTWCFLPAIPLASVMDTGPFAVPLWIMLRDLLNSFSVGVTMNLADALWIDGVLFVLFVIGIFYQNSKFQNPNSKLGIWNFRFGILSLAYLLIPVLCVQVLSYFRPLYQNSRYLIGISPAFYLVVATGIVALARWRKWLAIPGIAVFLIGAVISLNQLYFDPRYAKDDHRGWASHLYEHARAGDFLILNSPHTAELYRYYAGDLVPMTTLPILRADGNASPDADLATVREAFEKNERVWYLAMHVPFDDPQQRIETLLHQEGVLIDQANFAGTSTALALSLFLRALPIASPNDIAQPLNIAFEGHLRLRGVDVPKSIEHGKRGIVKLFWQIDEPVGEDYAASLRLVNEGGTPVRQLDALILGNRAGTMTWKPKQILIDAHDLQIAAGTPPGKYRLQVVPYHSATGNPLGDVVTLGYIEVK